MNLEVKKKYWNNGIIKSEVPCQDNNKQGTLKKYNIKGKLTMTIDYCDNKINGLVKTFYDDGQLESVETYVDGQKLNDLKVFNIKGYLVYSSENIQINNPICNCDDYSLFRHI